MINRKNLIDYSLLIFWMGVIYYLSSQPDLKSGFESQTDFILRKAAHITEYGILTFLAWHAASDREERRNMKYLIIAIIFSILYAMSDEYHQLFVHGRVGSLVDVLIDSIGIALMIIFIKIKLINEKNNKL